MASSSPFYVARCVRIVATVFTLASALDNGAALTPPMGWLSWERFACNIDCKADPKNCINAQLYKDMADVFVADGWKEAGYEYINVDDCWVADKRDAKGLIQADEQRFPGGIKALCDYIHSKGLKCGLYTDIGPASCAGNLALNVTTDMENTHFLKEMDNFASWGIDSLKVDGCNQVPTVMNVTYPRLSKALVASQKIAGHPIVFSCSWPAYLTIPGAAVPKEVYAAIAENCNIWRVWDDIYDSWASLKGIIGWYKNNQQYMADVAGPGHFNDPDMIIAGNTGLSQTEYEAQFALWSIFAAPLLMSNDLRSINADAKALLQNPDIIAVNQDKLGKQGKLVAATGPVPDGQSVWARPLDGGDVAVAIFNGHAGVPGVPDGPVVVTAKDAGISETAAFTVYDLLQRRFIGDYHPVVFKGNYTARVTTNGVHFVRLIPTKAGAAIEVVV